MTAATPAALYDELHQHVRAGTRQADSTEHFIDVERYVSQQRHDDEQQYVFREYPLVVGHSGMLPEPGSCWTANVLGIPLLVCRAGDGELRAFYNVCRHRHTRLIADEGACRRARLVCPYHGWAYDLQGRLLNIPMADSFPNLDKSEYGLIPLTLQEQHGLLFVTLSNRSPLTADELLAPIGKHLNTFDLRGHVYFTHRFTTVACNWKVIYDAFSESYHIKRLHHESLAEFFLDNMVVVRRLGMHMCSAVARSEMADESIAANADIALQVKATFNYHIFPNSLLIVSPDYMNMLTLFPQSPSQTLVLNTMLIPAEPEDEKAREHWQRSFDLLDGAVFRDEDFRVSEAIQTGLSARIADQVVAGRHEQGIRLVQGIFDEAMQRQRDRMSNDAAN